VASKKECHYFTVEFHKWPLSYYASLFKEGEGRVRGEITPGYNVLRHDRIRFVRKILPDVRLILIVRNPIDRAWSSARRQGFRAVQKVEMRFEDIDYSRFIDYFRTEGGLRREKYWNYQPGVFHGHYTKQIDAWTKHFSKDQLLVVFFEEIEEDPEGLMRRICKHIGASTDIDWDAMPLNKVINKNPEHPIPAQLRSILEEIYKPEIERLYERFGERVARWRVA
jgi:hypothetical protein